MSDQQKAIEVREGLAGTVEAEKSVQLFQQGKKEIEEMRESLKVMEQLSYIEAVRELVRLRAASKAGSQ